MPIIDGTALIAYLNTDAGDANALEMAANAACSQVQGWCGRTFDKVTASEARLFRPMLTGVCYIDDVYDATGLTVEVDYSLDATYATAWTAGTDFSLDPPDGRLNGQQWPFFRLLAVATWSFGGCRGSAYLAHKPVRVTTDKWGWADYPDDVVLATLMQGARLFKRRTSPEGVLGGFADFGVARVSSRMDPDVADLLTPYRWAGGLA